MICQSVQPCLPDCLSVCFHLTPALTIAAPARLWPSTLIHTPIGWLGSSSSICTLTNAVMREWERRRKASPNHLSQVPFPSTPKDWRSVRDVTAICWRLQCFLPRRGSGELPVKRMERGATRYSRKEVRRGFRLLQMVSMCHLRCLCLCLCLGIFLDFPHVHACMYDCISLMPRLMPRFASWCRACIRVKDVYLFLLCFFSCCC